MTNFIRLALVATAVFASTATVMAQVRGVDRADLAYAQALDDNGNRILLRSHSTNPAHDVYDGQRYLGSDPSMQIRSEILRDRESQQR